MPTPATPAIPCTVHQLWLGRQLPDLGWLAARTALDRAGLDRFVLHGDRGDPEADQLRADLRTRGVELATLDPTALFRTGLSTATDVALERLWQRLERPAARADLARLAVLWHHGGVYLDTDALVVRTLRPLHAAARPSGYAGLERVCLPAAVVHGIHPGRWLRAGALLAVRDAISRLPDAAQRFERIARHYHLACNNAVLAFAPRHPLCGELLDRAARMPLDRALRLYELGPRLLEAATQNRDRADFALHPPATFYPLAPEICAAYVDPRARLAAELDPGTRVAHLYDSVIARRLGRPADVRLLAATRGRTWLARAAEPYLDDLMRLRE
jgi:hypothetical protein